MRIPFYKAQGIGNDFIILDHSQTPPEDQIEQLAPLMCHRNYGIGADGILIHKKNSGKHIMTILNSDGSYAEMCGNGIRCLARYIQQVQDHKEKKLVIHTQKQQNMVTFQDNEKIAVNMGAPSTINVPINYQLAETPFIEKPIDVQNHVYKGTYISMSNPHIVIFVDNLKEIDITHIGPALEHHPLFPEKTNVHFCKINSFKDCEMITWERGAGRTLACGSGACAVAYAGKLTNRLSHNVDIRLPGGMLTISIQNDHTIVMEGDAKLVYKGEWIYNA